MAHFYRVTDMKGTTEAHEMLGAILKQDGPVTYSYYRSDQPIQRGTPEQRYRLAQARLEQPAFREAVIAHYGHRCVVTNCATVALLDAAHLPGRDWRLGHNRVSDGIPLRVDLHRALDRGLIELNKRNQLVWVSPELNGMYGEYLVASKPGKRAYPLNKS
jgi:predicted restriction endonuclease